MSRRATAAGQTFRFDERETAKHRLGDDGAKGHAVGVGDGLKTAADVRRHLAVTRTGGGGGGKNERRGAASRGAELLI